MVTITKTLLTFAIVAAFLVHHGNGMLFFYHVARTAPTAVKKPIPDIIKERADQMWNNYYANQGLQFIFPGIGPLPFCRGNTVRIGHVCSPMRMWLNM